MTEAGGVIEPNDPAWGRLQATALAARGEPGVWLGMQDIYGATAEASAFRDAFARHLRALWADGIEATLRRHLTE
jgi:mannitol 2-dehydrogenase